MGKNQSASNLTNIIKQDASGNITFVSGSTTLMSVSSSGAVTTTGNVAGTASYASNADLFDGLDSTVFATTGSNTFRGSQYISSSFVPTNFTDTASVYTDGGLRVTKNAYLSSSLYIAGDLIIFGSQSVNYITSSQLNIADNIITVNTSTPAVRFGGIAVQDSGSLASGLTGSLLWDSQNNHWIYTNPSGSSYSGGMLISGPRNTGSMGDEQGTTLNAIMKGMGGDHITSSGMFESGSNVGIGTSSPSYTLDVNGTGRFSGKLTGANAAFSTNVSGDVAVEIVNTNTTNGYGLKVQGGVGSTSYALNVVNAAGTTDLFKVMGSGAATFSGTVNVYDGSSHGLSISNSSGAITFTNNWSKTTFTVGSAQDIEFNDDGGVKRLFLKNGGNVGIGTSNITGKLMIYQGSAGNVFQSIVSNQGGSTRVGINFNPSMSESDVAAYEAQSAIYATDYSYSADIIFATKVPGAYANSLTERMRINYDGGIQMGFNVIGDPTYLRVRNTNTGGYPSSLAISLYGYSTSAYFDPIRIQASYPGYGLANFIVKYQSNSAEVNALQIRGDGWIYIPSITDGAGSYALKWRSGGLLSFDTSSSRYKDNIRNSNYGLSDVMKLRSAMFEYKKDVRTDIGLIAEEVYEVIPELVTLNEDGLPDAVSYDRFVSVLIKAIQELKAEIDELKNR